MTIPFNPVVDQRLVSKFKDAMAQFPTGVSIVTSVYQGTRVGVTVSSLTSLSLNPPLILICLGKQMFMPGAIQASGVFAVNILGGQQVEWGKRFAAVTAENRFSGIQTDVALTGSPILPGCAAWLDCALWNIYDGGDHLIVIGDVKVVNVCSNTWALLYCRRQWRQLLD